MYSKNIEILPGDRVLITKSERNWVDEMDLYQGKEFIVKYVYTSYNGGRREVKFEEVKEFPRLNVWSWIYEHDHFIVLNKRKKITLKFKLNQKIWG